MLKISCLAATLSTALIALLPLAAKLALAQDCYMLTSDNQRIDLSSLCKSSQIPTYTISKFTTHNYQWGLGLNLPLYCQKKYGSNAFATLRENNALGWKCFDRGQVKAISFGEACSLQYGPFARPGMGDFDDIASWHCRLATPSSPPE
jgi:hypothetical protein